MWCHNDFHQSSNYHLLSSNSYTQQRLTQIWWQSRKISINYSISRYSDHSRLLDVPFTLLVTSMNLHDQLRYIDSRHDSRNFGSDSRRLGFETDDSRLDSGLGPWKKQWLEMRLDSRWDSHDSCTALFSSRLDPFLEKEIRNNECWFSTFSPIKLLRNALNWLRIIKNRECIEPAGRPSSTRPWFALPVCRLLNAYSWRI